MHKSDSRLSVESVAEPPSSLHSITFRALNGKQTRGAIIRMSGWCVCLLELFAAAFPGLILNAEPVPVRYPQGSGHAFLALKTLEGKRIATGDVTQMVNGDRVTSHVIFRFSGTVPLMTKPQFSPSAAVFRLISDHHIQHGPSFPKPT